MTTQEFLTANRSQVIDFFHNEIEGHWNISLKDFMMDVMNNFKKVTLGEELKKFDIFSNLTDAKSRLGCFDNAVEVKFNRDKYIAKKYAGTVFGETLAL